MAGPYGGPTIASCSVPTLATEPRRRLGHIPGMLVAVDGRYIQPPEWPIRQLGQKRPPSPNGDETDPGRWRIGGAKQLDQVRNPTPLAQVGTVDSNPHHNDMCFCTDEGT